MDRKTYIRTPYFSFHRFRIPPGSSLSTGKTVMRSALLRDAYVDFWLDTRNWSWVFSLDYEYLIARIKTKWYQLKMTIKYGRQEW